MSETIDSIPKNQAAGESAWEKVLKHGPLIVTMAGAVLFFLGRWSQAIYYREFGIDINALDLPFFSSGLDGTTVLAYWSPEAVRWIMYAIIFVFASMTLSVLWRWLRNQSRSSRENGTRGIDSLEHSKQSCNPTFRSVVSLPSRTSSRVVASLVSLYSVAIITVLFLFAGLKAQLNGRTRAEEIYKNPHTKVVIRFKETEDKQVDKRLAELNANGCLRLLAQTKDSVIVFAAQSKLQATEKLSLKSAYIIPVANLVVVHGETLDTDKKHFCNSKI